MLYTIENNKLKVVIASLGATIVNFINKDTNIDMVLGFDDEKDYLENKGPYFGATVGRYANRIGNGTFKLNGNIYHTPINDTVNTLHGGKGISFREFNVKEHNDESIVLTILLKDGEDGFPGNVSIDVKYELVDNKLRITYTGLSDDDTVLNLTNHSYFNLNDDNENICNHEAKIYTSEVALLDKNGLSADVTKKVDGTSFDFRDYTKFIDNFNKKDDNLSCGGIDHNFVFENMDMKKLITIRNDKLILTISSDLPGVQIYTSNFIDELKGKNGNKYHKYQGVAIEPQYYPNAINYEKYLKPIIKKGEEVKHYIEYVVEKRG